MITSAAAGLLDEEAAAGLMAELRQSLPLPTGRAGPDCPRLIGRLWSRLVQESGVFDPLLTTKRRQNEAAFHLLPAARDLIAGDAHPFARTVELVALGNSLDALFDRDYLPGELPPEWREARADREHLAELERRADAARSVAYLADNCGEAVFDLLLLQALRERGVESLSYVTRRLPVLNDITEPEARELGIGELATILSNGIGEHLPGTDLELLGPEARRVIEEADLVIVKGGGNFKLLVEEPALQGRAVFLFQGKCRRLCRQLGVRLGTPMVLAR